MINNVIIFLDFDGVLCSYDDLKIRDTNGNHFFRDYSIEALNILVAYYGAKIVISSSWRSKGDFREIKNFQKLFDERGIKAEVIGVTPHLNGVRGKEINAWLDANPSCNYIILDDETADMEGIINMQYIWKTNRWRCLDSYDVRSIFFRFDRIFAGEEQTLTSQPSN